MKVGDIMTQKVISVRPTDRIANAVRLMLEYRISGLPVVDDEGRLVGMVTEGDLLRRTETGTTLHRPRWLEFVLSPGRLADEYVHTHGRRVDEVMTRDVVSVTEATTLDTVVTLMERRRIKRVPVVLDNKVIGIVSRADLLRALGTPDAVSVGSSVSDRAIRQRILNEIQREPWGPRYSINVIVHEGKVELWGTLFDERERLALRVAVENMPGVKAIHDHLVWVEPVSGTVLVAPEQS